MGLRGSISADSRNVGKPFDPENAKHSVVVDFGEHVEPVEPVAFRIRNPIELSLSEL